MRQAFALGSVDAEAQKRYAAHKRATAANVREQPRQQVCYDQPGAPMAYCTEYAVGTRPRDAGILRDPQATERVGVAGRPRHWRFLPVDDPFASPMDDEDEPLYGTPARRTPGLHARHRGSRGITHLNRAVPSISLRLGFTLLAKTAADPDCVDCAIAGLGAGLGRIATPAATTISAASRAGGSARVRTRSSRSESTGK